MGNAKVILAVALLLGLCTVAQASSRLVDQTGTPWGGLVADTKANKEIADDFTLVGWSAICEIGINGYFDTGWEGAALYGFYLNVYSDASGAPGALVSSQHITSGFSVAGDAYTVPVSDIFLDGGTYWLGIKADIQPITFGSGAFKLKLANGDATNGHESSDPGVTYVVSGSSSYNMSDGTLNGRYWWNEDGTGWYGWRTGTYTGSFPTEWSTGNNSHPEGLDVSFSLSGLLLTIPEPSSVVLLGMGLVGLLAYGWRKRKPSCCN